MLGTLFSAEEWVKKALREGHQEHLASTVSDARKRQSLQQHPLDIRSRLASWLTARGMDRLTREADRLFQESCTDPILAGYSVGLPLGGLPEIQRGLSVRGAQHGYEKLADVVRAVISRDWRQLSSMQIEHATDLYLCCLSWPEECSNIAPLAPVALAKENSYA